MPGYEISETDKSTIDPKYICCSCEQVLRGPVQTPCGHFYCLSCIDDLRDSKGGNLRCKVDQKWLSADELFSDKCVTREILNMVVNCPQKPCTWIGTIAKLQIHILTCMFALPPCLFDRGEMVQQSDMKDYSRTCKKGAKAVSLGSQPITTSSGKLSYCVFEPVGCKIPKNLTEPQLMEHNKKCGDFHMDLLVKYIVELEQDLRGLMMRKIDELIKTTSEQAKKIQHLEKCTKGLWGLDAEALLRRLINVENENANVGVLIVELNSNIMALQEKVLESERQREADARTINQLKTQLCDQSVSGVVSGNDIQSIPSWDGILLWKISDVARKRNESSINRGTSYNSPPFYTDRYGYKMCARIYLDGDGMGRGQYLSLFFVVMRGEHDALLRWPFRHKVTMMLLDQNNVEHVIDAFKPDPSSSSFQKPKQDKNIASGCPMFCPLSELGNHAYVKDDTMFVKIIVETLDSY